MIEPDGALGAGDFVAQVHAASEGPTHFELSDGAVLEADEGDAVVFGVDGVDDVCRPST